MMEVTKNNRDMTQYHITVIDSYGYVYIIM